VPHYNTKKVPRQLTSFAEGQYASGIEGQGEFKQQLFFLFRQRQANCLGDVIGDF